MKYTMMPVIKVADLREELIAQHGSDFLNQNDNLRRILFDCDFCNDSAKKLHIWDTEEWDDSFLEYEWFNERHWHIHNCTLFLLQELFPDHKYVMIDIT